MTTIDPPAADELETALRRALAVVEITLERRAQLEHALQARIVVEQAKGILSERHQLTLQEAFEVIRGAARSNSLKVQEVARLVVESPQTPDVALDALRRLLSRR